MHPSIQQVNLTSGKLNQEAGKPYEKPPELRQLPLMPNAPTPDQLTTYALLSNASGSEQTYLAVARRFWSTSSPVEGTQKPT